MAADPTLDAVLDALIEVAEAHHSEAAGPLTDWPLAERWRRVRDALVDASEHLQAVGPDR